jgi:PIN domain nuclease of toxin-antitoxin system
VRLLLDTHVLLWWLTAQRLAPKARAAVADATSDVWVSTATIWEMAIKSALGRLTAPDDIAEQLRHHQFQVLAIDLEHGLSVHSLPPHHADPFDRMLVAQARHEELTIVTRDKNIALYDVAVLRA